MSSPIILKRDLTTFTYLTKKRNLQGLSLHIIQKTWKLHQQSYARRATILKLITGWNVDGYRYALYTQDPKPKSSTHVAPYAWHLTLTYIRYANVPAQQSKHPGTH
jgi:hypothetical protein